MSHLIYVGGIAGLVRVSEAQKGAGGDANSEYDYIIVCTCGAELGSMGKFRPNSAGERSAYCPQCQHATIMNKDGQCKARFPYKIQDHKAVAVAVKVR